jgi:hypothetical protein
MRYALVDDATLEAAKRIEGKAVTKNSLEATGDILAMENLLQAILFCDRILYLAPQGKKQIRESKLFKSFQQVCLSEGTYARLLRQANGMTDHYIPSIEGGRFTDALYGGFFKALGIDLQFVWEKRSGYYCLSPRIKKSKKDPEGRYGKEIMSTMQTELSDRSFVTEINPRIPLLYDSEGQIINNCYEVKDRHGVRYPTRLSQEADAFFKALNYMALRANLHLLAARELKTDLLLSPMRSLLQWGGYNLFFQKNREVKPLIRGTGSGMAYTGGRDCPAVQMDGIPMFAYWIAEHMHDRPSLIQAALELREEKEFSVIRECLYELCGKSTDDLAANADTAMVHMGKINSYYGRVMKKYRIGSRKSSYSAHIALMGSTPQARSHFKGIESFNFDLKTSDPPFEDAGQDVKHCGAVYRPFRDDLELLDSNDEYYDLVTSRVWFKTDEALQNIKASRKPCGLPV